MKHGDNRYKVELVFDNGLRSFVRTNGRTCRLDYGVAKIYRGFINTHGYIVDPIEGHYLYPEKFGEVREFKRLGKLFITIVQVNIVKALD